VGGGPADPVISSSWSTVAANGAISSAILASSVAMSMLIWSMRASIVASRNA
jgi:hypothetical protein